MSVLAYFQVPEAQGSEPGSDQVDYLEPHFLQHAPNLAGLSLGNGHSQGALFVVAGDEIGSGPARRSIIQGDALLQAFQRLVGYGPRNRYLVGLWDVKSRMGEVMSEFSVIGEKQKPKGVKVEPANRVQSGVNILDQIRDQRSSFRIVQGTDGAEGLVQHQIMFPGGQRDFFSVHPNVILSPECRYAQCFDRFSVNRDFAAKYPLIGFSSRCQPR